MKIVQINTTCGAGSTGKICMAVSQILTENKTENYILYSSAKSEYSFGIKYSNILSVKLQALYSRIAGNYGFDAKHTTKKLIKTLKKINPDIIHIHNIHSHACNLEILFNYIRKNNIKTYWTFHDCWAFTGYCPHFDMIGCDKWKSQCYNCIQSSQFSWFFDRSKYLYNKKKQILSNLNLTIITPSEWLAGLVKQSFLKDYPVKVINNGIDLSIFKPTKSNFREKYNIEDKFIILGVAYGWGIRKGLDVFCKLSEQLENDKYKIVLVGTDDNVDKQLPDTIISIHRTQNQTELAEIYTAADLLINPTREENYPTVNMEAIACGTPVLTFDTGGSPEILDNECGSIVPKDDIDAMFKEIIRISSDKPYLVDACLNKAKEFNMDDRFSEYIKLYEG